MEIVSREAAQQIVDTVKDVFSQNINFIDEKGLSEDALCRVVIVRLNVRYNPNNLFMIQSAITQALRSWPATIRVNLPMQSSYTVLCGWKISRNHKNDGQVIKKISQKVLDF